MSIEWGEQEAQVKTKVCFTWQVQNESCATKTHFNPIIARVWIIDLARQVWATLWAQLCVCMVGSYASFVFMALINGKIPMERGQVSTAI